MWSNKPSRQALLEKKIKDLEEELRIAREGIVAVEQLMDESYGVAGLHLNGDIAAWGELRKGGRFEAWLSDLDTAIERFPK